jgi:hypothetical protein
MTESTTLAAVLGAVGRLRHARLFRQNVGLAWLGQSWRATSRQTVTVNPGDVVIRNARALHVGVEGMADCGGWRTIEVGGQRIAQVLQIEIKSVRGRLSPEQANWARVVTEAGGVAGTARSVDEALALVES